MTIPHRLRVVRPYLASFIHSTHPRPPFTEVVGWLCQPGKEHRAEKFIERKDVDEDSDSIVITFRDHPTPFYYPRSCNWDDLCQTIDECFRPANWHHFITPQTPIGDQDVVVDCGAAEGLFTFVAAPLARKVYAIEPIPKWQTCMKRTFAGFDNVELVEAGLGHKNATMRMTDDEIYSRISPAGSLEVPIVTVDSLFADKGIPITFLKADVEGFEFPLLLGAEQTIRESRPKLALTVYHKTNHVVEIREFLNGIHPDYKFKTRGIAANGNPILILAY